MGLKELEYIVAIAETGSISQAAERLYLAQSSLSQFLSRYETELGTRLFLRTAGGVRLTQSGEVFIRNARQMLRQYRRMKGEMRELNQLGGGHIDFGISSFRGSYLLPRVLDQFQRKYPGVEVVIHEHDTQILLKKVTAGELDICLVALSADQRPLTDQSVMRDEVVLVASREHPVMEFVRWGDDGQPWVALEDTLEFEYLLSDSSTVLGSIAEQLFARCRRTPKVVNDNLTAPFAAAMARQGLGLAFTYRSCVELYPNVEYLSIGEEKYFVDLTLAYPPDGYRSKTIRALEQMIRLHIARVN